MTPDGSPGGTSGIPRLITYTRRGAKGRKGNSATNIRGVQEK